MKFGLFYEHQLPKPWTEGAEQRLFHEALEQAELADKLGLDHLWQAEHHFLEEYSHSSAPEIFLAACSQRTKNIRIGHGVRLMPSGYNHPARVAEQIGTLDIMSNGRVEWGTGESASRTELDGYGVPLAEKRAQWRENVEQAANMMAMTPYPGYKGASFSLPCRNVVPKPVQKPHPPLWLACSTRESIRTAARCGMGVLSFVFVSTEEAKQWVDEYYKIFKEECVPIGWNVNPNIAMFTGFSTHKDSATAHQRAEGFRFFGYALGHYYLFGTHYPGVTDLWSEFKKMPAPEGPQPGEGGIGTPDELRKSFRAFSDAGVDQVAFIQQGGNNKHAHICEALELFAKDVMPEFKDEEERRQKKKAEELAPYIEAAMKRKKYMEPIKRADIPSIQSINRKIAEGDGPVPFHKTDAQ